MAASFCYAEAARGFLNGEIDVNAATVKAVLCMSSTTADTDYDATDVSAMTLDEYDGAGYTAGGHTLTIAAPAADGTGQGGFASAVVTALTILNLGAGTRDLAGVLFSITSLTPDMPLCWLDYGGADQPDGTNWTLASIKLKGATTS